MGLGLGWVETPSRDLTKQNKKTHKKKNSLQPKKLCKVKYTLYFILYDLWVKADEGASFDEESTWIVPFAALRASPAEVPIGTANGATAAATAAAFRSRSHRICRRTFAITGKYCSRLWVIILLQCRLDGCWACRVAHPCIYTPVHRLLFPLL